MSDEQKMQLEAVSGWMWDARADQWGIGFRNLLEFFNREGHCRVSGNYKTADGYRLGQWVSTQRRVVDSLPIERRKQLEAIQGWMWDALTEKWETAFRHLCEFSAREGHCKVPTLFQTTDGFRLGLWVRNQRTAMERLPFERKSSLEALPGWVWKIRGS